MAADVEFAPRARSDLIDIGDYIHEDNPTAAARVIDMIVARCVSLSSFPERGRRYDQDYRALTIGSYVAFYRAEQDTVVILHILHGARDIARVLRQRAAERP